MDQGIWATWYDVDEKDQLRYLDWAHKSYMPFLQQRPGFAWVAHYRYEGGGAQMRQVKDTVVSHTDQDIGAGNQYLMLVGAPSTHTFFNPFVDDIAMPEGFSDMLALREGVRTVMFTEEARVEGPSGAMQSGNGMPAPAIQMGTLRARSIEAEFDLIRWYAQYRLPSMAKMQGCVRTRKLTGVAGWAKHGILYEFESLEMRLKHFEQSHESLALDPTHWTNRITRASLHAPGSPFIGARIWPSA